LAHVRVRHLVLVGACVILFVAIEALSLSHQTRRPLDTAGATGAAGDCGAAASPSPNASSSPGPSPSPVASTAPLVNASAKPEAVTHAAPLTSPVPSATPSSEPATPPSPCPSPIGGLDSTQVNLGSGAPAKPTITPDLSLTLPPPTLAGLQVSLSVALKSPQAPIAGASVTLGVDGQNLVLQTNTQGAVDYSLRRDTPPGTYPVTATYAGDSVHRILPATATGQVTVLPRIGTAISLSLPPATMFDQEVPISAVLSAGGVPLAGDTINLAIDGVHKLDLIADPNGTVTYKLSRGTPPGAHAIGFTYHGNAKIGIAPATASGTITILPPIKTWIGLSLPPPTKAGQKMTLTASLQSDNGPLRRHAVHISIDGKPKLGLITDDSGIAHLDISRSTPAGTYTIAAEFHGDRNTGLSPSNSTGTMTILPLSFNVQTVPALAGVIVNVDGVTAATNTDGVATLAVAATGDHNLSVEAPDLGPGARTQFARWSDGVATSNRSLRMLADARLYAAFSGDYLTRIRFVDGNGGPVDTEKLTEVTLGGPEGTTIALRAPFDPIWLHVPAPSRAVLEGAGTVRKFSVASGKFEGISVINRGDDQYLPHASGDWPIKLRIYTLNIHTRRPLVGGGIPSEVAVVLDSGRRITAALDSGGSVTLHSLPRGRYTVSVPHTKLAAEFTLSLTRSQDVTIPVVSQLEIALSLGLLALLVGAMILLPSRRWLVMVHLVQSIQSIHS
jgi:hypothetical protein